MHAKKPYQMTQGLCLSSATMKETPTLVTDDDKSSSAQSGQGPFITAFNKLSLRRYSSGQSSGLGFQNAAPGCSYNGANTSGAIETVGSTCSNASKTSDSHVIHDTHAMMELAGSASEAHCPRECLHLSALRGAASYSLLPTSSARTTADDVVGGLDQKPSAQHQLQLQPHRLQQELFKLPSELPNMSQATNFNSPSNSNNASAPGSAAVPYRVCRDLDSIAIDFPHHSTQSHLLYTPAGAPSTPPQHAQHAQHAQQMSGTQRQARVTSGGGFASTTSNSDGGAWSSSGRGGMPPGSSSISRQKLHPHDRRLPRVVRRQLERMYGIKCASKLHSWNDLSTWLVPEGRCRYYITWTILFTFMVAVLFFFMAGQYQVYQAAGSLAQDMQAWAEEVQSLSWGAPNFGTWLMFWQRSDASTFDFSYLLAWGGRYGPAVADGGWWRWVSSIVVHMNFNHVTSNMVLFWVLSGYLEHNYGTLRVVLVFIVSGVAGNFVSAVFEDPCVLVVGASGSIFGLIGLYIADLLLNWESISLPWLRLASLAASVLFLVIMQVTDKSLRASTSNASHVGGFLAGLSTALLLLPNLKDCRWQALNKVAIRLGVHHLIPMVGPEGVRCVTEATNTEQQQQADIATSGGAAGLDAANAAAPVLSNPASSSIPQQRMQCPAYTMAPTSPRTPTDSGEPAPATRMAAGYFKSMTAGLAVLLPDSPSADPPKVASPWQLLTPSPADAGHDLRQPSFLDDDDPQVHNGQAQRQQQEQQELQKPFLHCSNNQHLVTDMTMPTDEAVAAAACLLQRQQQPASLPAADATLHETSSLEHPILSHDSTAGSVTRPSQFRRSWDVCCAIGDAALSDASSIGRGVPAIGGAAQQDRLQQQRLRHWQRRQQASCWRRYRLLWLGINSIGVCVLLVELLVFPVYLYKERLPNLECTP